MQEAGERQACSRGGNSKREARIKRDRESRGGFEGNGRRDCVRHRLEKGIGCEEAMRRWRGKRWKIPATPRLICSSAHLFSSSSSLSSSFSFLSFSPCSGYIFFWGLMHRARSRVHGCLWFPRVLCFVWFCICASRYIGIERRGWSREGREKVRGDHPGIASAFLIRAFHTMISCNVLIFFFEFISSSSSRCPVL